MRKLLVVFCCVFCSSFAFADVVPELPREYVNATFELPSGGSVITVSAGGDLQAAINSARLGDVIVLEANATFSGAFNLTKKNTGSGWIYIISSDYANLPAQGTRVSPSDADHMPKIVASGEGPVLTASEGAHHYRLVGIHFYPQYSETLWGLISLGTGTITNESKLPHHVIFDRCYMHGDKTKIDTLHRAIYANVRYFGLVDSYIEDIINRGWESHAISIGNSPGPFKIVNNFIEGAAICFMSGGVDPSIPDLVPADFEIRGNHFFKRLEWQSVTGNGCKNLFELKNARRVLVEGNVFENNWAAAQDGRAVLFTVRNQGGTAPWCTVEDVTFRYNIIKNSLHGFNFLGRDYYFESGIADRIWINDNILVDIPGQAIAISGAPKNVVFDHNTNINGTNIAAISGADGQLCDGFVFRNGIWARGTYGFFGDAVGEGNIALSTYFNATVFERNAIIGGNHAIYPSNNYFPADVASVEFINATEGNYRLSSDSDFKSAGTDGADLGADVDAVESVMALSWVDIDYPYLENFVEELPPDPDDPTPTTSGPLLRTGAYLLRVGDGVLRVQ